MIIIHDDIILHTCVYIFYRNNDVVDDPVVKQIINDQTKQWSEMLERHRKENWQLTQAHLKEQEDKLKVLMQAQQELQMKELEYIFKK